MMFQKACQVVCMFQSGMEGLQVFYACASDISLLPFLFSVMMTHCLARLASALLSHEVVELELQLGLGCKLDVVAPICAGF